jgi:hypothetical protein
MESRFTKPDPSLLDFQLWCATYDVEPTVLAHRSARAQWKACREAWAAAHNVGDDFWASQVPNLVVDSDDSDDVWAPELPHAGLWSRPESDEEIVPLRCAEHNMTADEHGLQGI